MPNSKVEIKAIFEKDAPPAPTEYTVTVTSGGNGTASASHAKAVVGTEITLTVTPDTGYRFKEWEIISGGVAITNNKFTMPSANVEVKAIFEKDAPPAPTEFTITVKTDGNGTASYLVIKGAELFRQPEIQHFHDQLEVEVEAAGVEVGGAEQGVFAVDEQELGVGEGRGLAVNLHAPVRQHGHLVAHGPVHKAVVVLAGQDDAHVHAAQDRIDHLVLTFEDTDDEPVEQVCADMNDSVTNPQLGVKTILDRAEAVETTVSRDRKDPEHLHIILIIGKGNERWFKDHGKHIPYEGDDRIVERVFRLK